MALLVFVVILAFSSGFSYGRAYQAEIMANICSPEVLHRWRESWKSPGE